MRSLLDSFKDQLDRLFGRYIHGDEAHDRARQVLKPMAADPLVLEEIVKQNLERPGFFLSRRENPVIALKGFETPAYTLVVNCWLPRPDRRTDVSHQSIHHHGHLLLTSISAFGSGYESILFKRGFHVNAENKVTAIEIDKIYRNPRGHVEFVSSFTPHVVFYPASVSVTYALWSNENTAKKRDRSILYSLKKNPLLQKYKPVVKQTLGALGLTKLAGLNDSQYLDFYPDNGRIVQMKTRIKYKAGTASRDNLSRNFMYFLRETKFQDPDFIASLVKRLGEDESQIAGPWLSAYLCGRPISDSFDPDHVYIDKVTLRKDDILGCFEKKSS